ncbi:MAG: hypothetical protein LQ341_002468 [Variospora aurantia]|nr:MAG: hypothetical protein LQ341_002468 [Variospora aurantia]
MATSKQPSHQQQQQPLQSSTLQVDFTWRKWQARITSISDPSQPIYIVDYQGIKAPHIIVKTPDSSTTIGTGTLHPISIHADYEIHGRKGKLKALKRWRTKYTHLSRAFANAPDSSSLAAMTWTSSSNFKTWDFICLDEQQIAVAKFSANMWGLKKIGMVEFLTPTAVSEAARDEIVVTGLTLAYCMILRTSSILSFVGAIFARTGPIEQKEDRVTAPEGKLNMGKDKKRAVPSFDRLSLAVIDRSQLLIRSAKDGIVKQNFDLAPGFAESCRFIKWYGHLGAGQSIMKRGGTNGNDPVGLDSQRLLLADDTTILVYDVRRPALYAEISGATGLTSLGNIEFGHTPDEVMVFSDFDFKIQIWSLITKRAIEIKDPKSASPGYDYRPTSGHLALLIRPAVHDILMIIAPHTHEVLETSELLTIDAQGIKYSPDSNWIAIWDTPSAGCRVLILTADGQLFKAYSLPHEELNLGVRSVQWSPDSEYLAIGDDEGKVTFLGKNKFTPRLTFVHYPRIDSPQETVWQEEIGPSRARDYAEAKQPAVSPSHETFRSAKESDSGISLMEFNHDGSLIASKCNETPSTLRIYSPRTGRPLAALIHHAPIRSIQWHEQIVDLLLIQCAIRDSIIYVWKASWSLPKIYSVSLKPPFRQLRATWLASDHDRIQYMLGNSEQFAIGQLTLEGEEVSWQPIGTFRDDLGPEDMFDEGHSLDLSPVKVDDSTVADDTSAPGLFTELGLTSTVEDTFHYRR